MTNAYPQLDTHKHMTWVSYPRSIQSHSSLASKPCAPGNWYICMGCKHSSVTQGFFMICLKFIYFLKFSMNAALLLVQGLGFVVNDQFSQWANLASLCILFWKEIFNLIIAGLFVLWCKTTGIICGKWCLTKKGHKHPSVKSKQPFFFQDQRKCMKYATISSFLWICMLNN